MTGKSRKANGKVSGSAGSMVASGMVGEMVRMAVEHFRQGDLGLAETICSNVRDLEPNNVNNLHLLGIIKGRLGRFDEAEKLLKKARAADPGRHAIALDLSRMIAAAGRSKEAVPILSNLLKKDPANREAQCMLADCLRLAGDVKEAERAYRDLLVLDPGNFDARMSLGTLLISQGRPAEAEEHYRAICDANPRAQNALANLGALLLLLKRFPEARAVLKRADDVTFNQNVRRMHALAALEDRAPEAAVAICSGIRIFQPLSAASAILLGDAYQEQGLFDQAVAAYDTVLAADREHAEAQGHKALALLSAGRFEEAWPLFEARRLHDARIAALLEGIALPEWTGAPMAGKRVLVVCEQGMGDMIQFARLVRPLADLGAHPILYCPPALMRLFATLDGAVEIHSNALPPPPADLMVPLASLPMRLGVSPDRIPGHVPYLVAEEAAAAAWKLRLGGIDGLKVGVHLRLADRPGRHSKRSLTLDEMAPILAVRGVAFCNLSVETFETPLPGEVFDPAAELTDIAETAALIAGLDVVVTVDTMLAHLASALGKPTWMLATRPAEWRWGQEGDAVPWYPTMRAFRQDVRGDWSGPVARVVEALKAMVHD